MFNQPLNSQSSEDEEIINQPILVLRETSEDEESLTNPTLNQTITQSSSLDEESDQNVKTSNRTVNRAIIQPNPPLKRLKPSARQHKLSSQYAQRFQSNKQAGNQSNKRKKLVGKSVEEFCVQTTDQSTEISTDQSTNDEFTIAQSVDETICHSNDQTNDQSSSTKLNPSSFALLLAILRRSDGRDKLFRTVAFFISALQSINQSVNQTIKQSTDRTSKRSTSAVRFLSLLAAYLLPKRSTGNPVVKQSLRQSLKSIDSGFAVLSESLLSTRQLLRFGRWLTGYQSINEAWEEYQSLNQTGNPSSSQTTSNRVFCMLDLINAIFCCLIDCLDDVTYLSDIGVIKETISETTMGLSTKLSILAYCIDIPLTVIALKQMHDQFKEEQSILQPVKPESSMYGSVKQSVNQSVLSNSEFRSECLSLVRYCADLVYCLSDFDLSISQSVAQSCACLEGAISLYKLTQSQSLHRMIV